MSTAATEPSRTFIPVPERGQPAETARRAGARVCVARYGFGFPTAEPLLDGSELLLDNPEALLDVV